MSSIEIIVSLTSDTISWSNSRDNCLGESPRSFSNGLPDGPFLVCIPVEMSKRQDWIFPLLIFFSTGRSEACLAGMISVKWRKSFRPHNCIMLGQSGNLILLVKTQSACQSEFRRWELVVPHSCQTFKIETSKTHDPQNQRGHYAQRVHFIFDCIEGHLTCDNAFDRLKFLNATHLVCLAVPNRNHRSNEAFTMELVIGVSLFCVERASSRRNTSLQCT
jgi:hypothetical protein